MQKQSARIMCINNLFKPSKSRCVFGQNSNIFTSLRRKKVQCQAQQFKELFSLVCYFFALNSPSSALNHLKNCSYLNQSELSNFFY